MSDTQDNNGSKYPECDKMAAVRDQSMTLSEFVDWLGENGMVIASYQPTGYNDLAGNPTEELRQIHTRMEQLFADFFNIDLEKVEDEKQAMLEEMRVLNDA